MYRNQDIVLVVDYHDQNLVIRRFNCSTGEETLLKRPTHCEMVQALIGPAVIQAAVQGGTAIWVMESTTGWARVKWIVEAYGATFLLANVLQLPLPPKAYRRKTDKLDTARLLRELLNGTLPLAYQPSAWVRQVRRLTACRESLVGRRTGLRNWINRHLAHETWHPRTALWGKAGMQWLRSFAAASEPIDGLVLSMKLDELDYLEQQLARLVAAMAEVLSDWRPAQRLQAIRGIGVVSAVSIAARIGSVNRFEGPEGLIAYAGLAPGIRQSDDTRRTGGIGGPGTDTQLRHYIIEATLWARQIPRYRKAYERVESRRGAKIARLHVGRLLLRSIHKIISIDAAFNPTPPASSEALSPRTTPALSLN